jgi:hypothetical protein
MKKFNEKELLALINIYLDPDNTTEEEIKEHFKETGFDPEESVKKLKEILDKKPSELKLEKGKNLRERIEDEICKTDAIDYNDHKIAVGFRKGEKMNEDDVNEIDSEEDKKKLEILRKMRGGE